VPSKNRPSTGGHRIRIHAYDSWLALVAFLAAPTAWAAASEGFFKPIAPWLDVFSAHRQLSSAHPLQHLAWSATAISIWVIIPSTIGLIRSLRRDVK